MQTDSNPALSTPRSARYNLAAAAEQHPRNNHHHHHQRDNGHSSTFKFTTAIVCRVSNSLADDSTDVRSRSAAAGAPALDISKCRSELERFVEVLRRGCGLDVIELPSDEQQPLGVFVGDIAVVIGPVALICNPPTPDGRYSRQGEKAVVRHVLRKELGLKVVEVDNDKATVVASDVLWTGREIFVGLSTSTNIAGAQAVAKAFPEYSTSVVRVHAPAVHLKDCINVIQPEVLIVSKSPSAQRTFKEIRECGVSGYRYIMVNDDLSTNVLFTNNALVRPANDQIPNDVQIFADKLSERQLEVRFNEILKRGRLPSCVILVSRTRKTRRYCQD